MTIQKDILLRNKNIFVVKLKLEAGDTIPSHSSAAHVTASVTQGNGIFIIEDKEYHLTPGVFLSMLPFEKHSITAHSNLDIIVHHILLPKDEQQSTNHTEETKICEAKI